MKFTLIHNITENALEDDNPLISEVYDQLVKKVLSLSQEVRDGQMIEDLITIIIILSSYINESKVAALATSVFHCCSVNRNSEAFFILLETSLAQVYSNELELGYKLSSWKASKILKALFKWLTAKIDTFSVAGVKFATVLSLYNSMKVSIGVWQSLNGA